MIAVERLTARYGRTTVLDAVDLAVDRGSVFVLLGRNGAGKSTLFKILLGQRRADAGSVRVLGLDPWRDRVALVARLGATPETPDAPPAATLRELLDLQIAVRPGAGKDEVLERLRRFKLDLASPFERLSRGQRSLFLLALALANRPELLLLDDPTLGLDPVARRYAFEEVVSELADRGTTVLLSTHDADAAARVATHVGILNGGRLVAHGAIDAVLDGRTLEERFFELTEDEGARR